MSSWVGPLYSVPSTRDVATPAFKATLMAEADPALPRLEALRRTNVETTPQFALEANIILQVNMGFGVNLVLVER